MPKVEKSITVNAPVEKVFNYVGDPMNQLEWLTSMTKIHDVTGSGVGKHFRWVYKMVGVPLAGESTITEHIPNERLVMKSKGGVTSNWIFTFESHDGGTKMELNLEYTIPVPVLGKLAEKLVLGRNEREADLAMVNIKDKMEG